MLGKLFVFVEESIVHGLDEFVFVGFEGTLEGSGLFGEIAIQAVFGVFLHLVFRLRELYFDVISSTCHSVVHTHGMVQVGSIDHVFYVSVLIYPVVLLNHDFMKGVGEVFRSVVSLNLLVQSGIQLHNGVIFLLGHVLQEAHSSYVVPVLRVVLQIPSIIVLFIQLYSV